MSIFRYIGLASSHAYRYVIVCIVATIIHSVIFKKKANKVERVVTKWK